MYRVLRHVSSSFASFIACLGFILLFAFSQHVGIANYNYLCLYAHEATHAMLLSIRAFLGMKISYHIPYIGDGTVGYAR